MDLEGKLLEIAEDAAEDAGKRLLKLFGSERISVRRKFDYPGSIVTNADREAEKLILDRIRKSRIKCSIISEEAGTLNYGSRNVVWAVDPLDGTFNYVKGIPHFAVINRGTNQPQNDSRSNLQSDARRNVYSD